MRIESSLEQFFFQATIGTIAEQTVSKNFWMSPNQFLTWS